jgi:hypothetical protein
MSPFLTQAFLEVAGNRIFLRCEADRHEMTVASLRALAQWATGFLHNWRPIIAFGVAGCGYFKSSQAGTVQREQ